ncbi:MAG: histidine phosphatase family protein [Acidimicrobiia bacterium]
MSSTGKSSLTRVFFVRHGVTEQTGKVLYGHTKGLNLNDEGKEQARLLAEYFRPIHVDIIVSSPLERAYETAQAIAEDRDLTIEVNENLIDTNIGDWTNFLLEDCAKLPEWKTVLQNPSQFCFPGGESFVDVYDRMSNAVRSIVKENENKNIVITCHRDPIIILLASYLGVHMDMFQRIPCYPASLSQVVFENSVARVENVNVLPAQRLVHDA